MRITSAHGAALALLAATALLARPADAQSLRGSPESVDRMYQEAQRERLSFHETPREVRQAASSGSLVRLSVGRDVELRNVTFPYVTTATAEFVARLGSQHRAACGKPLMITSAARPSTRQPRNSVAQSVHPTGMAVDLRKPTGRCLTWLRATLLELEDAGVIEATEEFRPPHFHVAVYPTSYARYAAAQPVPAPASTVLATVADATPAPKPRAARAQARSTKATRSVASAARPAQRYRVRAGDTLWDIARSRGLTVKQILAANRMSKPVIRPGQRIVLPNSRAGQIASADVVGQ